MRPPRARNSPERETYAANAISTLPSDSSFRNLPKFDFTPRPILEHTPGNLRH